MPQKSYFEWFELPETLRLDVKELQKRFYALSRAVHPDFHQTASEAQKALSLEASAELNQAFLTLKDREKRLQYVLTRHLGELSEAEKKQTPPELLMRLMEIREQLEHFKRERSESLRATLQHEQAELEAERNAIDQQIDTLMQAFDEAATPEAKRSALMEIRKLMLKKNYLHSLIATIQNELNPETV